MKVRKPGNLLLKLEPMNGFNYGGIILTSSSIWNFKEMQESTFDTTWVSRQDSGKRNVPV